MDWEDGYIRYCLNLAVARAAPPPQARSRLMQAARSGAWREKRPRPPSDHRSRLGPSEAARLPFNLLISCWLLEPGMIL